MRDSTSAGSAWFDRAWTGAATSASVTPGPGSATISGRRSRGWPPSPVGPPTSSCSRRTGRPIAGATCRTWRAWPRPAVSTLRIFARDGDTMLRAGLPEATAGGNADLVREYANDKNGQRFASVPVAVFFTRDFVELYRYVEYPAIYHKDRVIGHLRAARSGESEAEAKTRGGRDIATLLDSPFFDVWAHAAIAEILSALHERLRHHSQRAWRRVHRPPARPGVRRAASLASRGILGARMSGASATPRKTEERHGSAGARETLGRSGGDAASVVAPATRAQDRGAPRLRRGATNAGGFGGPFRGPPSPNARRTCGASPAGSCRRTRPRPAR